MKKKNLIFLSDFKETVHSKTIEDNQRFQSSYDFDFVLQFILIVHISLRFE